MQQIKTSEATAARRRIPLRLVDDAGDAVTGLTFSAGDLRVVKNGGAAANAGGTVTEEERGGYYYEATQAETDTVGYLRVSVVKTGTVGGHFVAQVVAFDPYDSAGLGLSRLDAAVSSRSTVTTAQVNAEVDTALADYDPPTRAEATADKAEVLAAIPATSAVADAIWDEALSGHTTAGTAGKVLQTAQTDAALGRKWRDNAVWLRDGAHAHVIALEPAAVTGQLWAVLYDDDGTTPIAAQHLYNKDGGEVTLGGTGPASRAGSVT